MKRIISIILIILIIISPAATIMVDASSGTITGQENFSNLVVFVDFSDTSHKHNDLLGTQPEKCFLTEKSSADTFLKHFDGDENHPRAMKQYLDRVSGGKIKVLNLIPQYNKQKNVIEPLKLRNTASYYASNEPTLIGDIIKGLKDDSRLVGLNLDLRSDGLIDNLMIVVPCEGDGNTNTLFRGHMTTYGGSGTDLEIAGKQVSAYTVVTESGIYSGISGSGLIIHEFMHTLGFPDLYINGSNDKTSPVGAWDIMASENYRVQFPLAYMRYINGWISSNAISNINSNIQNITLRAPTTDDTQSGQQAVILKTPYSDDELFVVEYRKKISPYLAANVNDYDYEVAIPNSGIIIYRINKSVERLSNMKGAPFGVYIFRSNDTRDEKGETATVNAWDAYLPKNGIDFYGSSDPADSTAQNAITYSDGRNSGIVIKNISAAGGNTISFDIEFNNPDMSNMWQVVSTDNIGLDTTNSASCMTPSGAYYFVLGNDLSGSNQNHALVRYDGNTWTKVVDRLEKSSAYKLAYYNGAIYMAYIDSSEKLKLSKLVGSSMVNIPISNVPDVNEFDLTVAKDAVYVAAASAENVNIVKSNGSDSVTETIASNLSYASGVSVDSDKNGIAVVYCDYFDNANGQPTFIKYKSFDGGSWKSLGKLPISSSKSKIKINNGQVYVLKTAANTWSGNDFSRLYKYDSTNWLPIGDDRITGPNVPEAVLEFYGDTPYIFYADGASHASYVKKLLLNGWDNVGFSVTQGAASDLGVHFFDGKIYVSGVTNGRGFIRSYANSTISPSPSLPSPLPDSSLPEVETPGVQPTTPSINTHLPGPTTDIQPPAQNTATIKIKKGYTIRSTTGDKKAYYIVTNTSKKKAAVTYKKTKSKNKNLTVPVTIKDKYKKAYKVTQIAPNAFKGNKRVTKITINGKYITKIGKNAFKGIKKNCKIIIKAKNKKQYKKIAKMIKKSGAKNVKFYYKN